MPLPPAAVAITPVFTGLTSQQTAWSRAQPLFGAPATSAISVLVQRTDDENVPGACGTKPRAGLVLDSVLDELAVEAGLGRSLALPGKTDDSVWDELASVRVRGTAAETVGRLDLPWDSLIAGARTTPRGTGFQPVPDVPTGKLPVPRSESSRQMTGFTARLAVILLAAGPGGYASGIFDPRSRRAGRVHEKRKRAPND